MANDAAGLVPQKPDYSEATLSILGYREGEEWVALALEMDLRGYGETWDQAVEELRDLVLMQISFARTKDQPEMIWRDAEPQYWDLFRKAQRAQFAQSVSREPAARSTDLHAGGLAIPPAHAIAALDDRYQPVDG